MLSRPTAWARRRCARSEVCDLTIERGRVRGDHGPVGLGQVDADEHPRLPRRADRGSLPARRATTSRSSSDDELAEVRNRKIGFVFQQLQPAAADDGAGERRAAAALRRRAARRAARAGAAALEQVGLGDAGAPPAQPALGRPAAAGGDRPRAGHRPALLLADEPTGNLDTAASRRDARDARRGSTQSGRTIVLITHEEEIAAFAQRVVRLRDGRIVSDTRRVRAVIGA